MFERTTYGLQNIHRFFNVDLVVFVEGGTQNGDDDDSPDIRFWSIVLNETAPHYSFHFIARGGKPTLLSIADQVISGDLSGVLVALDADYDRVMGRELRDHRIFYTYGYSWENDVWLTKPHEGVFLAMCFRSMPSHRIAEEIADLEKAFLRASRWIVAADMYLCEHGRSLVPRRGPQAFFAGRRGKDALRLDRPRIKRQFQLELAQLPGRELIRLNHRFESVRWMVGHFLEEYYYRVICYLICKYSRQRSLHRHTILVAAFNEFRSRATNMSCKVWGYHRDQVRSKLLICAASRGL
ncbi:MAG: DUF4435 domain-containing protein [Geminicoccaceae bacterium]